METKQLRIFAAIVEAGSFTRAGHRLSMSQPAISHQLAALERELGVALVVRGGAGARPTAAGEALVHYARQVLAKLDEAKRFLSRFGGDGENVLRVGATGAFCERLLPSILKELRDRLPDLQIRLSSARVERTLARLAAGELDAGLVPAPVEVATLRSVDIGRDELVAVAAAPHRWAARARIQPADFASEPLIVFDRGGRIAETVEAMLLEAGVSPRTVAETDRIGAAIRLVREGVGVAVLPRWAVRDELDGGTLVGSTIGGGLGRKWALAVADGGFRERTLRDFVQLCSERLPRLIAS